MFCVHSNISCGHSDEGECETTHPLQLWITNTSVCMQETVHMTCLYFSSFQKHWLEGMLSCQCIRLSSGGRRTMLSIHRDKIQEICVKRFLFQSISWNWSPLDLCEEIFFLPINMQWCQAWSAVLHAALVHGCFI